MMARSASDKGLSRLVEERVVLKKEREEKKKKQQENLVPYLPKECIFNMLVRLPLESLQRSRLVCKPWYKIVNSPIFVDAHLRRSETVFIFLTRVRNQTLHPYSMTQVLQEKEDTFSVEGKLFDLQNIHMFQQPVIKPTSKFHMKFMEIKDGKCKMGKFNATCLGNIRATCNGLILLDNKMKKGGIIVMNPVTRELSALPLGTLSRSYDESYGLAFCSSTREYKLVHLFRDELQFVGCEILNLATRSWKMVDGPSFGLFGWFGYEPVSALGALHWVPHIDHSEYIVSMTMDEEKFHKMPLPKSSRTTDRIVEMGGLLCFVTHEEMNQIDLWCLRNLSGDDWKKHYTITVGCIKDMVPLCCSRISGEMIFRDKDGSLYAYDFHLQLMEKVQMENICVPIDGCYLPHVNSLVSWRIQDKDQDDGY